MKINRTNLCKIVLVVGLIISTIVFTYFYVHNESPIYIFDYSGYFENYKLMGNLLVNDFRNFITTLMDSIRNSDYNYSSVVLLMPFYLVLGTSRFAYIVSLTTIYLVPCVILITYSFMKLIKKENQMSEKESIIYLIFTMMIVFMYTRLWSPTLRGLSDISGLIPIILAYLIITKKDLMEKQRFLRPVLLGIIIYLPFLFRRWYVFFIIGFYFSMLIVDLLSFIKMKDKKQVFWTSFKNYFLAGISTLVVALILQLPLLKNILMQNYGDAYNGYQTTFMEHFQGFYNEFGLVIIIGVLIGIVLTIVRKKYCKCTLFCLLNIIIFWFAFGRIQSMGVHHFLGITFWVIMLFMIGVRQIYELCSKNWLKYLVLCITLLLFMINFSTTYIFRNSHLPLISQNNKYYKFRYYNFDELSRLIDDLENLMVDKNDDEYNRKFSVLADSEVISDNLVDLLGGNNIKDNIVYTTHIDSRDGVSFNSLLTKYVVVTDVSQLGTNANGQYVIDVPNRMIYENYGIGKAYERVSEQYLLDNNVKAYIYEKKRDFTNDEVEEYFDALYEYYPEWKEKYNNFDKNLLKGELKLGTMFGSFKKMDDDTYFFYPGVTDTTLSISSKNINKLKLKFYIDYSGTDSSAGITDVKIYGDNKKLVSEEIDNKDFKEIELDLKGVDNIKFVISGGKELNNDWLFMDILECS